MKNIVRFIAVAVLLLSAVTVFAQNSYQVRGDKVYYGNIILHDADPNTIRDLGYGYAKDMENVWWEGKLLPMVDARTFCLKKMHGHDGQPGNILDMILDQITPRPGGHHGRGYEIVGTNVYFDGHPMNDVSYSSFRDLGWGYAKDKFKVYFAGKKIDATVHSFKALSDGYALDSFDVYYFGVEIEASTSRFTVLEDGYAKDAFDAYYCGKEVKGSVASSFKVLGNGYAEDAFDKYYLGKKITQ